jgi:signal transduction histidine kinase
MPSSTDPRRLLGRLRPDGAARLAAAAAGGRPLTELLELGQRDAGAGRLSVWLGAGARLALEAGEAAGEPPADALDATEPLATGAGLAVPLRAAGRTLGVLWAGAPAPRPERLQPLADVLALAVALSQATEQLEQARGERSDLFDHAVRSAEREREQIAHLLHDGPLQLVTAMRLMTDVARRTATAGEGEQTVELLDRIEAQATQAAADLRAMTARLHPVVMEQLGLHVALGALAEAIEADHGVACAYSGPGAAWEAAPERDAALYGIAHEAAVSAARNGASELRLRLADGDGQVELAVEHGALTPASAQDERELVLGARLMRERAERIRAVLRIERPAGAPGGVWVRLGERDGR